MKHFDIIIAGGGMAGATAALTLAKLGLSIALVESIVPNSDASISFDQRAVALSAASVSILQSLDIWSQIKPLSCAIENIHISDRGHFGFTRLNATDFQVEALGQVIPLDQTGPILWQQIKAKKNIEVFCPFEISQIKQPTNQSSGEKIALSISNGDSEQALCGKLLLAADGTFSSIAKMSGINTTRKSYRQHAIIANIATEKPHKNRAFERFTEQGPLALLPLTQNRLSLVWCHDENHIDQVIKLDDRQFTEQLQSAFGYRLGAITKVGQRSDYPLALHLPAETFKGRVLLIGNAAHTLHPIAGQGFNIGLRDIAALYDWLQNALDEGQDIGEPKLLEKYQQQRQADWHKTITATDSLVKLFSNDFLPLVIGRDKALFWLDKLPFAKRKLAMAAMGFSGHSAQLTRGLK